MELVSNGGPVPRHRSRVSLHYRLSAILGGIGWDLFRHVLVVLALSIVASLAVFVGLARAEAPALVPDGQFESVGALGVAVDQSASESDPSRGDVYVAGFVTFLPEGFTPGRLTKADASGNLLSPSPFGEALAYSGAAVNPTNGNVYVIDALNSELDTYDPSTGVLLPGSLPVPGGNFLLQGTLHTTVVQIAADSAGNVYVPVVSSKEVLEYSPTGELLKTFKGGSGEGALHGPTGVAVDSAGNLWVADAGNERLEQLSPADSPIREISSPGVQAVAVDAHGDVFATVNNGVDFCGRLKPPCPHLMEYSPAGAQLADLGAGSIGAMRGEGEEGPNELPHMVEVNKSTGRVYVTDGIVSTRDGAHGRVLIFTPPVAPKPENELALDIGTFSAKLGAVVNPGGLSAFYRFEYGTTEAYGNAVPFPEGDTGGGFQPQTVWASASGLLPGMTYHYRVVVTGAIGGAVVGKDRTFTTETAAQASCPNEPLRTGPSASLPDCRAYELVTPPNKAGAAPDTPEADNLVEKSFKNNFAALDGNRVSFQTESVYPGSPSAGRSYVATRRTNGWSLEDMFPPTNYYGYECPEKLEVARYSADLSKAILPLGGGKCGGPEPELVSGEPQGIGNLFVRDNTDASYQLVDVTPPGVTPTGARFVGASVDLSHVVFREEAKLTPNAPSEPEPVMEDNGEVFGNLYEWHGGVVRLLSVLPDGTPVAGSFVGISPDGSRIFFTYAGNLYARVDGASTVQLDASQAGGSGGGGSFVSASADGSQALITDDASAGLTGDTAPGSGRNLYRYDFPSGRLTDLTPASPAEVKSVASVSDDGSHVYFEAQGSLAPGATLGQPNSYLWNAGTTRLIPALGRGSANGAFLAIVSSQHLTGYDNTDTMTGQLDPEIYLYDAAANSLVCASCNPSGASPTGGPRLENRSAHTVSDNGQVFFETSEALLPADTNGKQDVYEFEPDGVGSCGNSGGCLSLISTGAGTLDTWFIEASLSGNDVFLLEHQKLVPQDTQEEAQTIYDVRVDGGIPEPAALPACSTADACRTALVPQPSIFGAPASQTFSDPGNLALPPSAVKKCRKGFVKKKGKCVKKPKKKANKSAHTNKQTGK